MTNTSPQTAPSLIRSIIALLPGAVVAFLAADQGGTIPAATGLVTVGLLIVLALWIAFAREPFENVSLPLVVVVGALAAFATWQLVSGTWSEASYRALLEFDRTLLYLTAIVLFGLTIQSRTQLRIVIWGLAAAITSICAVALATHLYPDVWQVDAGIAGARLSFPITYWNALAVFAATGLILALHLTGRAIGSWVVRVLAAAALPLIVLTLYFTFSRGGIVAAIIGIVVYLAVGRPRGLISGLLAVVPTTAVALIAAAQADLLASNDPESVAAAAAEGHHVAFVLALCMLGAAAIRVGLLPLDRRLASLPVLGTFGRRRLRFAGGCIAVAIVTVLVVRGVPGKAYDGAERFFDGASLNSSADLRDRLTQVGSPARLRQWEVSLDQFAADAIEGEGAGTWANAWAQQRPVASNVQDAHSLYLETLGELGLVGLTLLLVVLVGILGAFAAGSIRRSRPTYAALLAVGLAWAAHAAVDWDWEVPATAFWLFATGGAALGSIGSPVPQLGRVMRTVQLRGALILGLLALATVPYLLYDAEEWLGSSRAAFAAGDCRAASHYAKESINSFAARPEPYEVLGYCAVREGRVDLAVSSMREAVSRDPDNWKPHYGLAIAEASSGRSARRELRTALRLNPFEPRLLDAKISLQGSDKRGRAEWAGQVAAQLAGL